MIKFNFLNINSKKVGRSFVAFILLLIIFTSSLRGQTLIQGIVLDKKNSPIEYVNILLLTNDSIYVDGTISDENGLFTFSNAEKKSYLIKLTCLGFENHISSIMTKDSLQKIIMEPTTVSLKEVTISEKKKIFSVKNGNLTMDVQNSLLKSLGNGIDIVSHLPGVISDNENNLSVIGKGTPLIYIDGRQVYDKLELMRLNSNDILSIEFVGTPGAQYDGETKAIIKIKTIKKQKEEGFAFRFQATGAQGEKFSRNEALDLTYKISKLDIRLSLYDYNSRKISKGNYNTIMYGDAIWNMYDQSKGYSKYQYDNISANINYEFNVKHNINLLYNYTNSNPLMINNNRMQVLYNNILYTDLEYSSNIDDANNDNRLNFSYLGHINNVSIDINLDYFTKNTKQDQINNELSNLGDRLVKTNSETNYDIYAGKFKTNYQLSSYIDFNTGIDLSYTKRNGIFYNEQNIVPNTKTSIIENKNNYFFNINSKIKKLSINAGIRYEYQETKQKDLSTSITEVLLEKNSHILLPDVNISYIINQLQLSFSASKRIKRPTYYQLREGIQYNGRFEYDKGNPYLTQEKVTTFALSCDWQNLYMNLGYNRTNDYIGILFYQDVNNSSLKIATPINYDLKSDFNLSLNYNKKISFWNPQISVTCIRPHFKVKYLDKDLNLNKCYAFFQLYNDFVTNSKYIIGLDIIANTSGNMSEVYLYKQIYTNISARKTFINNSLDVTFKFNDIFKSSKRKNSNSIGTVYYSRDQYNDTRLISLTVTYKFNNFKAKRKNSMAGDEEINRTF